MSTKPSQTVTRLGAFSPKFHKKSANHTHSPSTRTAESKSNSGILPLATPAQSSSPKNNTNTTVTNNNNITQVETSPTSFRSKSSVATNHNTNVTSPVAGASSRTTKNGPSGSAQPQSGGSPLAPSSRVPSSLSSHSPPRSGRPMHRTTTALRPASRRNAPSAPASPNHHRDVDDTSSLASPLFSPNVPWLVEDAVANSPPRNKNHRGTAFVPPPLTPGVLFGDKDNNNSGSINQQASTSGHFELSRQQSLGASSANSHTAAVEVSELFRAFVHRLPEALARPLLRALTIQVVTERMPGWLLNASDMYDGYAELRGELDYVNGLSGASRQPLNSSFANNNSTSANAYSHCSGNASASSCGEAGPAAALDLCRLHTVAPAVLRFRVNYAKELKIKDAMAQYGQPSHASNSNQATATATATSGAATTTQGNANSHINRPPHAGVGSSSPPPAAPTRAEVATRLLRPRRNELNFGAHLIQGAPRVMRMGSRLLLPSSRSAASSVATSPIRCSGSTSVTCYSSASFELMPSIFLKGRYDYRRHNQERGGRQQQQQHRSSRRRRTTPFFKTEFTAAFACGHDASALFATTFAPEFLVGLPTFLTNPSQSVSSAIRATLHRLYLVLTAEVMHIGVQHFQHQRHLLQAPPLDLSILYLREKNLYYASTAGIEGKLFFLNGSEGERRMFFELETESHTRGLSVSQSALDTSTLSLSGFTAVGQQGGGHSTFDMPVIVRGHANLQVLCAAAMETAAVVAPQRGGVAAECSVHSSITATVQNNVRSAAESASMSWGTSQSVIPDLFSVIMDGSSSAVSGTQKNRQQASMTPPHVSEASLPCAVVMATSELWSVLSASFVSDLLRVLLLLDGEATAHTEWMNALIGGCANYNNALNNCNNMSFFSGCYPPHMCPNATAPMGAGGGRSPGDFLPLCATAHVSHCSFCTSCAPDRSRTSLSDGQAQKIHRYIQSLSNCFTEGTLQRLEQFYEARVKYYAELDERNAQTAQQKLEEELQRMATQRTNAYNNVNNNNNKNNTNNTNGSPGGADTTSNTTTHSSNVQPPIDAATRPLCDALSAALAAEAHAVRQDSRAVHLDLPHIVAASSPPPRHAATVRPRPTTMAMANSHRHSNMNDNTVTATLLTDISSGDDEHQAAAAHPSSMTNRSSAYFGGADPHLHPHQHQHDPPAAPHRPSPRTVVVDSVPRNFGYASPLPPGSTHGAATTASSSASPICNSTSPAMFSVVVVLIPEESLNSNASNNSNNNNNTNGRGSNHTNHNQTAPANSPKPCET